MWLKNNNLAREELWKGERIARKMAFFSLCRFSARHEMGPVNQWARYNFCKIIIPWLQPSRLQLKKEPERDKCCLKHKDFSRHYFTIVGRNELKFPWWSLKAFLNPRKSLALLLGEKLKAGLRCGGAWVMGSEWTSKSTDHRGVNTQAAGEPQFPPVTDWNIASESVVPKKDSVCQNAVFP